jgi:FADH2-dependent halogenase/halogenation protein CepH
VASGHGGTPDKPEVIIVGGGPAGAVAGYVLATLGHSTVILEKAAFPRFHIGESTVPYLTRLFDLIGLLEPVEQGPVVHKHGVELTWSNGDWMRVRFSYLSAGQRPLAFNFDRTRMDELLLRLAQRAGAHVIQEAAVDGLVLHGNRVAGVRYRTAEGHREVRARFVIDASGRAGVISRRFDRRKMNPRLRNVAVFQQFTGLDPANNPSALGDQVVGSHREGWVWAIPLSADVLSVGTVMSVDRLKGRDPEAVLADHIGRVPRIRQRLEGGTTVFDKAKIESDYCYHTETLAGPGYFVIGDAGCFVDPLFSGGFYFAAVGAHTAATAISDVLAGGDEGAARHHFSNFMKTAYDGYFRLAYGFYEGCRANFGRVFEYYRGFVPFGVEVLCGDFWGQPGHPTLDFLRSKPEWATFEKPFEHVIGCPYYAGSDPATTPIRRPWAEKKAREPVAAGGS